jgi:hypothetical protein
MTRFGSTDVQRLLALAQAPSPETLCPQNIASLPDPVRRSLLAANVPGKRIPRTVHLKQSGTFRTSPEQKWFPVEAEEWHSTNPPGFVWCASLRPKPLIRISVIDAFVDGHGFLEARAQSLIPMGHFTGPETDAAELTRFLLETAWFPQYWASPFVTWQPVDEQSSTISIEIGSTRVSAQIVFGQNGLPSQVSTERYRIVGKRFVKTPYLGRLHEYAEVEGMLLPIQASVAWLLPKGEFEYFRATIRDLTYSYD